MDRLTPQVTECVLLEEGPAGGPVLFAAPEAVLVARTGAEVPGLLAELDAARADAHAWAETARQAIATLPDHPIRAMLSDIADYVVSRIT